MEKKRLFAALFGVILLISISLGSASFSVGNSSHSITKEYGFSENIKGWINISLNSEPSDSLFTDNFGLGTSVKLIDLVKKGQGFNYSCDIMGCPEKAYSAANFSQSKRFYLPENVSKIIGVKLTENILKIISITFSVSSDVGKSCSNQLKIDFGEDGSYEIGNYKSATSFCSSTKNYGCFEPDKETENYGMDSSFFCQKLRFKEAAGFKVGAEIIKKPGSVGTTILAMWLYDGPINVSNCILPTTAINASGAEVSCNMSYLVTQAKDYYLCINAQKAEIYQLRGNKNPEVMCGFYGGVPPQEGATAYKMFVQPKEFDSIGKISIIDTLPDKRNISSLMEEYIIEKYGSLDCRNKECIIPILFKSGKNQTIIVNGLSLSYEKKSAGQLTDSNLYDIFKSPVKISAGFQKLYLDEGNFLTPSSGNTSIFRLKLNDKDIFSENITISRIPVIISLSPMTTALGYNTLFEVGASSVGANITSYKWDFEGVVQTTTKNKASYAFDSLGGHNVSITVKDSKNKSATKKFVITVYSPEKQIEQNIKKIQASISSIKLQIKQFPDFYQTSLNSLLKLGEAETLLAQIQKDYSIASTEAEYLDLVQRLSELELPDSVSPTKVADAILFLTQKENVNLDILQDVGGGNYSSDREEEYLDAVIGWSLRNTETKIKFKEISAIKSGVNSPLLRFFELSITREGNSTAQGYLILENIEGLRFKADYSQRNTSGYVYIPLEDSNTIVFSTTEDVDFTTLPGFISPAIDDLGVIGIPTEPKNEFKAGLYILIIIGFLIGGFIVYVILENWYRVKYETHLFRDRNSLFNLITYINNQRRSGLSDSDIAKNLKKAKWSSEQINYALRKYVGKRTGMIAIPFLKIVGKNKSSEEKKMRQMPGFGVRRNNFNQRKPFY